MIEQPWACFSKLPGDGAKWNFDGFVEVEEFAVEYEILHQTEDGEPLAFTCQMPDLGEHERQLAIKERERQEAYIAYWRPQFGPQFEDAWDLNFCQLTIHDDEPCVIRHHIPSAIWPDSR